MTSHTEQLHEQIGPGPFVAGSIYRQMFELAEIADAALAERDQALQALQRVEAVHTQSPRATSEHFYCEVDNCDRAGEGQLAPFCDECCEPWPCKTLRALAGPVGVPAEQPRENTLSDAINAAWNEWNEIGGRDSGGETTAEHLGLRVMQLSRSLFAWVLPDRADPAPVAEPLVADLQED